MVGSGSRFQCLGCGFRVQGLEVCVARWCNMVFLGLQRGNLLVYGYAIQSSGVGGLQSSELVSQGIKTRCSWNCREEEEEEEGTLASLKVVTRGNQDTRCNSKREF